MGAPPAHGARRHARHRFPGVASGSPPPRPGRWPHTGAAHRLWSAVGLCMFRTIKMQVLVLTAPHDHSCHPLYKPQAGPTKTERWVRKVRSCALSVSSGLYTAGPGPSTRECLRPVRGSTRLRHRRALRLSFCVGQPVHLPPARPRSRSKRYLDCVASVHAPDKARTRHCPVADRGLLLCFDLCKQSTPCGTGLSFSEGDISFFPFCFCMKDGPRLSVAGFG